MHPLPLIDDCLFLDNSAFEHITTCPRSAEYYILQKKERSGERSALTFGGIIHKILEARYRAAGVVLDDLAKAAMLQAALKAFNGYTNEKGEDIPGWTPPEGDHRTYDMALDFILEYANTYPIESFHVLSINNQPAIEIPFAHPLFDYEVDRTILVRQPDGQIVERFVNTIRVFWQGRMDMVVETGSNELYGVDHKTTSMMGPSYFKEFEMASQFRGYTWAGRQLGIPLKGFIINGLGIRKPTKTGKKLEFQRKTVDMTEDTLDEWHHNTIQHITHFIEMAIGGFLPQNTKQCIGKYGACQFFDVCTLPREQRGLMLSTGDFKTVTWNPLSNEE